MSHILQKGTASAVSREHDNDWRDPIADRAKVQHTQAAAVQQDVCGSSVHSFPYASCRCAMSHILQKGSAYAVSRDHDNDWRDPIANRAKVQDTQAAVVQQDVCGSSVRSFPNASCRCAMSHILQKPTSHAASRVAAHPR